MKLGKLAVFAALCCGTALIANGQRSQAQEAIAQVGYCDCGQSDCGCAVSACDAGCDTGCGCGSGCPSGHCGLKGPLKELGAMCNVGDPYSLLGEHCNFSAGGWLQMGYTDKELPAFNTYDDHFQVQQAWLWAEKAIDTSCGFDIGGRIDYLYGTDGPNTQAFGTGQRGWDNSWDNGSEYGHAIPQLYMEAGYGDFSVIAGHFYTIIGYEVVPATGNFFYSHAYTFNFSEPFTHTGALAKYEPNDDITVWGGYSLGADSGFDNNGDSFLGGVSLGLTDKWTLTYAAHGGRLLEPWGGVPGGPFAITGFQHSIVSDFQVTERLNYVFQSDLVDTEFTDGVTDAFDTIGVNQYLIYQWTDCWGFGTRFEWWNVESGNGPSQDLVALTLGLNYRPHANLVLRPEIRWDWDNDGAGLLENGDNDQTTFGVDTVLTF